MKNVVASLLFGAAFVSGAAHAADYAETGYPFVKDAVSPVQQNLVVEQNDPRDSAYPTIRVQSTETRTSVERDLAAYQTQHPDDDYLGD